LDSYSELLVNQLGAFQKNVLSGMRNPT